MGEGEEKSYLGMMTGEREKVTWRPILVDEQVKERKEIVEAVDM